MDISDHVPPTPVSDIPTFCKACEQPRAEPTIYCRIKVRSYVLCADNLELAAVKLRCLSLAAVPSGSGLRSSPKTWFLKLDTLSGRFHANLQRYGGAYKQRREHSSRSACLSHLFNILPTGASFHCVPLPNRSDLREHFDRVELSFFEHGRGRRVIPDHDFGR